MLSDLDESTAGTMGLDQRAGTRWLAKPLGIGAEGLLRCSMQAPLECCRQLPELASGPVRLRELRLSDPPSLTEAMGCARVGKHLSPGPTSVAETEEFIAWMRYARTRGRHICFGVIPRGMNAAVGVFQLWPLEPSFHTAEWGFALGHRFWGTGLFEAGARLVTQYAFETLGVVRLEARAALDNVRGNGALKKLGAVPEGVLRKCCLSNGEYRDHMMWSILADDWHAANKDTTGQMRGETA